VTLPPELRDAIRALIDEHRLTLVEKVSVDSDAFDTNAEYRKAIAEAKKKIGARLTDRLAQVVSNPKSLGYENYAVSVAVLKNPDALVSRLLALLDTREKR